MGAIILIGFLGCAGICIQLGVAFISQQTASIRLGVQPLTFVSRLWQVAHIVAAAGSCFAIHALAIFDSHRHGARQP